MTTPAESHSSDVSRQPVAPTRLHHAAFVTHDLEATVRFYHEVLGLPITGTVFDDHIPSTGDAFPYFHVFFGVGDGSAIAFFEAPGLPQPAPPTHPAYDIFDHIAFKVESLAELNRCRQRLLDHGVDVIGPVDHKGFFYSIYFRDPSGHRLELVASNREANASHPGMDDVKAWLGAKRKAAESGTDVEAALIEMIRTVRRERYK